MHHAHRIAGHFAPFVVCLGALVALLPATLEAQSPRNSLEVLRFRNPDATTDLGVGLWAWPLPLDFDGDGDLDLLVSCPDKPFRGLYFFENPGPGDRSLPTFLPPVRVGEGLDNVSISYVSGQPVVLTPARRWKLVSGMGLSEPTAIYPRGNIHSRPVRANQWHVIDYNGDGTLDLIVGVGDWSDYGWDDAFDRQGRWTRGPLHGYVYVLLNRGTNEHPQYDEPRAVHADGRPVDVFGRPSPNFADFDGDGDLDLLCGEFLDGFTYYRNVGNRHMPVYARGVRLRTEALAPLTMDLQMILPVAIDWDRDGDIDLIVGDEDGRVAFVEHTGSLRDGVPVFRNPVYFRQRADRLKFGALATPVAVDFDGDGDQDLLSGNSAGSIGWFENLDGGDPPRWAPPRLIEVDGKPVRITAGPNGSIQGPAEAKWGYTTLSAADWDHDGRFDLIVNSIWGRVVWYRNVGTKTQPAFAPAKPIRVAWKGAAPCPKWNWWRPAGNELVTQWRTTPFAIDYDRDGLCDLVMLDHEGYLAWYRRARTNGRLVLLPGRRVFVDAQGRPLKLARGEAGKSGRRKLALADWNNDGRLDLLINGRNIDVALATAQRDDGGLVFARARPVRDDVLAGHTTSPAVVDWNRDGIADLVIGAEDGHFYYLRNPRSE